MVEWAETGSGSHLNSRRVGHAVSVKTVNRSVSWIWVKVRMEGVLGKRPWRSPRSDWPQDLP